jgi:hypothetical protein
MIRPLLRGASAQNHHSSNVMGESSREELRASLGWISLVRAVFLFLVAVSLAFALRETLMVLGL